MDMGWRKLGLKLEPSGAPLWRSHCMLPTPLVMADRVRVWFAACDADLRGRVLWTDIEPEPPYRVMRVAAEPTLDVGAPGEFDCDGANPSQVLALGDGRLAMAYIGWRRGPAEAPYTLIAGLAFSDDGGESFRKTGTPLLPLSAKERCFRTAAFISRDAAGWRILYIGGGAFISDFSGKRVPVYSLCEARSDDPTRWPAEGRELAAPNRAAGELGFGRPVLWDGDLMVSLRTERGYRLVRAPDAAFTAGRPAFTDVLGEPAEPWEAQMTCFGAPVRVGARELLFYNGNGFGRSGFGMAWREAR